MEWLKTLLFPIENPSVAQSMVTIMLAIGSGVFFGRLKLGKITFGVSAVMFTGLILGHLGYRINDDIFDFISIMFLVPAKNNPVIEVKETQISKNKKKN